jgi:hypothetical protein
MPSPTAFILLDEPIRFETSRIRESVTARHPDVPVSIPEDNGHVASIVLNRAGSVVAVMDIAARLDDGWQQVAHCAAVHWREPEAIYTRHLAHLGVSGTGDSENPRQIAKAIAAVAGAPAPSKALIRFLRASDDASRGSCLEPPSALRMLVR